MRPTLALLAALGSALLAAPARTPAAVLELAVDVPTTFGDATHTSSEIVRNQDVAYALVAALPDGVGISALRRMPGGPWLVAVTHPATLDGLEVEPRDVVQFDGSSFLLVVDGAAAGIPAGSRIDALSLDPATSDIVMSFEAPVNLAGTDYLPSDLVALGAGFSLYWSSAAAGVPASANVTGADLESEGGLVVTFDAPVDLGGTTFLPGQLARWLGGTAFQLHTDLLLWPRSSVTSDFSFLPAAGAVPDGSGGGTPLELAHAPDGFLTLSWGASCASTDDDYEIYDGPLAAPFTGHSGIACSTAGQTSLHFLPSPGDRYYLVVPRNGVAEGSYGWDSSGVERPPGLATCLPQQVATACP